MVGGAGKAPPANALLLFAKTEEEINTLLESLTPADEVFDRTTYEQCERLLSETLGETTTNPEGNESTRYNDENKSSAKDKNLEGVSDIETAFDDLLA